jgi:hypothetical protein
MWSFLGRGTKDEERSIVFLGEKFKRRSVFKWVDGIFLGELFAERDFELIEVCECVLDYLRAGCATEEKGSFGIFDTLGSFFVEGSFRARVAGLSKY